MVREAYGKADEMWKEKVREICRENEKIFFTNVNEIGKGNGRMSYSVKGKWESYQNKEEIL